MALLYASAVNKRINSPSSAQSSPAQTPRKISATASGHQQRRQRTHSDKMSTSVCNEEQDANRKCSTSAQLETATARMSNSNRSSEESLTGSGSGKTKRQPKPITKRAMTAVLTKEQHKDSSASRKISAPQPPRHRTGSESGRDKPPDLRRILAMKRLIEYSIEVSSSSSNSPSPDRDIITALSSPRKKISVVEMRPARPPLVRKRSLSVDTGAIKATLDEAIAARSPRKKDPIQGALSKIRHKFSKWKLRKPDRSLSQSDTDDDGNESSDGTVV